jgi:hypothetical protein
MSRARAIALAAVASAAPAAAQDALPPDSLEHVHRPRLAAAMHLASNAVPWAFNRYVTEQFWARVSPAAWRRNFDIGWTWDDNDIQTNQFAHPYHGALYYNAIRANGYSFWASAPWTFAGSWLWEHFGEVYPPSPNDFLTTSFGGITLGEVTHRLSSLILDNRARGASRRWKELGALLVDPVRGVTRIATGQAWQVAQNPPEWRPPAYASILRMGLRRSGDGRTLADGTNQLFLDVDFRYGNALAGVKAPFDAFRFEVEVRSRDTTMITRANAVGFLLAWPVVRGTTGRLVLGITNRYDYLNNFAYVAGGSSFGAAGLWRLAAGPAIGVRVALELSALPVTLIHSEAAERVGRDYDFGVGVAYRLEGGLDVRGREVASLRSGTLWSRVVNGSDAHHLIHFSFVNAVVPLPRNFAAGVAGGFFQRDSEYGVLGHVTRRTPELRLYLAWRLD